MIRSAAKNWQDVAVVTQTKDYERVIAELQNNGGSLSLATRNRLACDAFGQTSMYDMLVHAYLSGSFQRSADESKGIGGGIGGAAFSLGPQGFSSTATAPKIDSEEFSIETFRGRLPGNAQWTISKTADLRYGENPHQIAGLYKTGMQRGIANAEVLTGKEMSFNNYVDADAGVATGL
jgi:phosphoribosylaminoimidazolecarboxamide formyltransferase/IMP cyclohydrolase